MLAGLLGALTIAFSAILVKLAKVEPSTAAVFRCLYAVPLLALLAARETRLYGRRPWRDHWIGAVAGVLFTADLILWHHSIADVGAGLATVLGNLQVVLVAFGAWAVLGERPERRIVAAVPVVFTGAVMISGVLETGGYGRDPVLGTIYGFLTTAPTPRSCSCCGRSTATSAARRARCSTRRPPPRSSRRWRGSSSATSTSCRAGPRTPGWRCWR